MPDFKVGVQLHPQATTVDTLRQRVRDAEDLGVDSVWTWDHFYPLYGDEDAAHFEGWTLLTAFAADTERVRVGHLVTCNSYRNPHLLADMARTVDHISSGRVVLGVGAGWFERDYDEYEYPFGTAGSRLRQLEADLYRIRKRLDRLTPPPVNGRLPVLIGGGGEKVTLRLVAEYADLWNGFGPVDSWRHKNGILDQWCERTERDPSEIERTVLLQPNEVADAGAFVEAGAQHLIVGLGHPFDFGPVEDLLRQAGE